MKKTILAIALATAGSATFQSCKNSPSESPKTMTDTTFEVEADRFADILVLRYQIHGWDQLSAKQKELVYYLYQAALSGRDIIWDQKYKYNLTVRKTIEGIYSTYSGDKKSASWGQFITYAKRVWFSNGIHHHYASDKIIPEFNANYLADLLEHSDASALPLQGKSVKDFTTWLTPILFDPKVDGKTVNLEENIDHVKGSANHFYDGVTEKEVTDYYAKQMDPKDTTPISYGLNSQLTKKDGKITERVWKVGGMYSAAIEKMVYWLEKAVTVAENTEQKKALELLVSYYKTGDLKTWDEYNIAWVKDVNSTIDVVNGFIEVYQDALGKRASFESVVSIKDFEATKRIEKIASNAQWFEDNSPLDPKHKKKNVVGIIGKVINVVVESGDAAPSTPIGINLPNANWIREIYGSKSVSLGNIIESYNTSSAKSPSIDEFGLDDAAKNRSRKFGALAGELHTDMHEVIGHASGKINDGIGTPDITLKNYASTLEEARADLVALYYIMDPKLVEIGVMPSVEVGMAEYDSYILNGLMLQLNRIEPGKNLEEAHMRNRQLIAKWVYEKGEKDKVIEWVVKDGKHFIRINDYKKLRELFGQLLKEIQRIKSEGDYKSGRDLVEKYGVKVDQDLLKEVKARFKKLNVAPYKGFIQPKLVPVMEGDKIIDVNVEYPKDFVEQMMDFGKNYSFLPITN